MVCHWPNHVYFNLDSFLLKRGYYSFSIGRNWNHFLMLGDVFLPFYYLLANARKTTSWVILRSSSITHYNY